jgi:hypothetical protein
MAKVFVLGGKLAGKSVLLMNRYVFVDGAMLEENDEAAKLKAQVLLNFYDVKMVDFEEYKREKGLTEAQAAERAYPTPANLPTPPKTVPVRT